MKKLIWLIVVTLVLAAPLYADTTPKDSDLRSLADAANSSNYFVKFPGMIVRGLVHVVASPFEFFKSLYDETVAGKPVIGTIKGIGIGTMHLTSRALVGVWDIATSWVPQYNGEEPHVATVLTI